MDRLAVSRSQALTVIAVLAAALLLAGRFVPHGASSGPMPAAARAVPVAPAKAAELVVHVVGAVRRPGLYHLRDGSRVADAVARAGGATRKADLELVNLAAPVADGTQIVVPTRVAATAPSSAGDAGGGETAATGPVHLNTATLEQLDGLPGVGPVTAQKIIDYRQKNGAFTSVDDLDAIPGIGPKRLEQLRDLAAP